MFWLPPTEPGPLDESWWERTRRDAARVRTAWVVRSAAFVANGTLSVFVAERLVSANKPGLSIGVYTALAFGGAAVVELASSYLVQAMAAPVRQRNEARAAFPLAEEKRRDEMDAAARSHRYAIEAMQDQLDKRATAARRREDAASMLSVFIWDGAVLLGEDELKRLQVTRWGSEVAGFLEFAFGTIESTKFIGPGQPINEDDPREGLRTFMGRLREVMDRFDSLALRDEYTHDAWMEKFATIREGYKYIDGWVA